VGRCSCRAGLAHTLESRPEVGLDWIGLDSHGWPPLVMLQTRCQSVQAWDWIDNTPLSTDPAPSSSVVLHVLFSSLCWRRQRLADRRRRARGPRRRRIDDGILPSIHSSGRRRVDAPRAGTGPVRNMPLSPSHTLPWMLVLRSRECRPVLVAARRRPSVRCCRLPRRDPWRGGKVVSGVWCLGACACVHMMNCWR
jgi:hypothetical protein